MKRMYVAEIPPKYYTLQEVATDLKVSYRAVNKWVHKKTNPLPFVVLKIIGKRPTMYINSDVLKSWLKGEL